MLKNKALVLASFPFLVVGFFVDQYFGVTPAFASVRSTGSALVVQQFVTNFGNRGSGVEEVFVGDFNGDGKADVAIHNQQTGDWFVY